MVRLFAITLALCAALASAWAAGAADPDTFRLSPALLDRMEAVAAELRSAPKARNGEHDDEDEAESVEDIARKLDADPRIRAALARHGLTSREYATATLALLHAGMALAVEKAPGARAGLQKLTPAQRANLELVRARQQARK